MLSLKFRLVSQYICLLFIRILSVIDLVCCFYVSCVFKWCLVCVMCVPFNWIFGGFCFRRVNVIWLHLLGFAFICLSCSHFSMCYLTMIFGSPKVSYLRALLASIQNVSIVYYDII